MSDTTNREHTMDAKTAKTATPVEIDTRINSIQWSLAGLARRQELAAKRYAYTDADRKALADLTAKVGDLAAEFDTLNAEYQSRPWTRAYVVPAGHVHADYHCHTCFPETTRFLAAAVSGFNEDEVVAAAGERACTVCYPSAPVDTLNRPSRITTPDEDEAAAARQDKADAKAERDTKKAAKAIANPDGSPLRPEGSIFTLKTEHAAQAEYIEFASYAQACKQGYPHTGRWAECVDGAEIILVALAHKRGTTVEEQRTALAARVAKKVKPYFA